MIIIMILVIIMIVIMRITLNRKNRLCIYGLMDKTKNSYQQITFNGSTTTNETRY